MNKKISGSRHAGIVCVSLLLLTMLQPMGPVYAQSAGEAVILANTWDFGDVKEGPILRHNFFFKNDTAKPMRILTISTACGCLVCRVQKLELAPGETTEVKFQFETKSNLGVISLYADLYTDNPDNAIIRYIIKAHVH